MGILSSSKKLKDDIRQMGQSSDVLLSLHPVSYHYKALIDPKAVPQFGLVAEEVEKVDPDLVIHDKDGAPYTVRYEEVNAMLLNKFLKEHRTVELQEAKLDSLVNEHQLVISQPALIATQETRLDALQNALKMVETKLRYRCAAKRRNGSLNDSTPSPKL